jgi:hypothetical protein
MKSIVSRDALHNSLELANSKTPELLPLAKSITLKLLPSSIFF